MPPSSQPQDQPWAYGSPALVDLALYLARRAQGLTSESPAVRP